MARKKTQNKEMTKQWKLRSHQGNQRKRWTRVRVRGWRKGVLLLKLKGTDDPKLFAASRYAQKCYNNGTGQQKIK